ncbi:MAG: hypothetical protein GY803_07485 [Chloroflexi bacterium]|nr:hypothetical protein [Chloroflexota bacterium]
MNQSHENEHLLRLEKIHPSGAEEWSCVYCERRIMKQRKPNKHTIVLNTGITVGLEAQNAKDTEISHELWLTLEEMMNKAEMA